MRNVDIVFCIDRSAEMAPFLANIKEPVRSFFDSFTDLGVEWGLSFDFRVRFVLFGDYAQESEMLETDFASLQDGIEPICDFVDTIKSLNNSTYPNKNGIEAIRRAIMSDWVQKPSSKQIVVLLSNNDAGARQNNADVSASPTDEAPTEIKELCSLWACPSTQKGIKLNNRQKTLFLVTPENTAYSKLNEMLDRTVFEPIPDFSEENINTYMSNLSQTILKFCFCS